MFGRLCVPALVVSLAAAPALVHAAAPDAKLIDLNVVAVDSNQQPVTDLTQNEIQITDEGRNQPVVFFRHVNDKPPALPSPGPGEYSNGGRARARHATVILLDLLNQRVTTESLTANLIVRQLSTMEEPGDLFLYALTLDGKISPIHGLDGTEPGANPQDSAQKGEAWTHRIKPLMDEAMRSLQKVRPGDTNVLNVRIDLTLKALMNIGGQMSAYPGRKNLVWITDGIPFAIAASHSQTGSAIDFTTQLRQVGDRFAKAQIAIYPVPQFMLGSADAVNGDLNSIGALNILAGITGGRPDASSDIGKAVQQAMRDLRSGYQIGYYPSDDSWDGKFHDLRVTCTRKGVRIQTRTGYLASKEPDATLADRATGDALRTRAEVAEIGLYALVTPDPKVAHQTDIAMRITAEDVALPQNGDRFTGQLKLTLVLYKKDGNAMGMAAVPLKLDYDAGQREKALRDGIELNRSLNLDGIAMIRAIVFDFGSGATGSLSIPLDPTAAASMK